MSDELTALASELRALRERWGDAAARAALADKAVLTPEQRARVEALVFFGPGSQVGDVTIGAAAGRDVVSGTKGSAEVSGTQHGAAVGVNQGTIQLFFGARPPDNAKPLLDSYLQGLIADHGYLRLGKLLDRERSGRDQAVLPEIELLKVYTSLATDMLLPAGAFSLSRDELVAAMEESSPELVLPDRVRLPVLVAHPDRASSGRTLEVVEAPDPRYGGGRTLTELWWEAGRYLDGRRGPLEGRWYKPESLITAIAPGNGQPRLVLLGSPGSGKSTSLRHLTVYVASALLSGTKTLRIPFFCPLGPVAQDLGDDPRKDVDTLVAALLRPSLGAGELRAGLRERVQSAITAGNALLFFDGLDEVPGTAEPTADGPRSRRERLADAIRSFARQVGASSVVVTCRTRPYEQDAVWQLREGWAVRRLQPFAFGQIRAFIARWYAATCVGGQGRYSPAEAAERAERLVALLGRDDRVTLRGLAATPLLLTMLVLLDYNNTRMPEKRVDVYEELVKLLLDRWEGVRSSDTDRRPLRLGQRLELPHLTVEELRPALHELAFEAHKQEVDGRGVLTGTLLRETLDTFFARKLSPANPRSARAAAARPRETFMALLVEESGLLLEEDDERYVLPHLTFEEYLAACYLAGRDSQGVALVYEQWCAGGERWREVARLLMGRLLRQEKYDNLFAWLQCLVPGVAGQGRPALQRQRDALLAADCYAEIEGRAAFAGQLHDLGRFEDDLRQALVALLERPDLALQLPQRIEAADALAALGDPRFPVGDSQWRAELVRRNERFGAPSGYFCFVPGGNYRIGGWPGQGRAEEGVVGALRGAARTLTGGASDGSATVPLAPFWIARFPITVAQFAPFVKVGYAAKAERWWTKEGWKWKLRPPETVQPYSWKQPPYDASNQPVIGVTWYEASAFCAWLTEQLADALPPGLIVRLPTEAEWEAAAACNGAERRPYPWGEEEPTQDRAIYNLRSLGRPAPVGCCPAGISACGALDISGNVWETTTSR